MLLLGGPDEGHAVRKLGCYKPAAETDGLLATILRIAQLLRKSVVPVYRVPDLGTEFGFAGMQRCHQKVCVHLEFCIGYLRESSMDG